MLHKGDSVFYCDNNAGSGFNGVAFRTVKNLGLTPLVYAGVGLEVRKSSLDKEIRDDFYRSKVVVVLVGSHKGWKNSGDCWALPELAVAESKGIDVLIYAVSDTAGNDALALLSPTHESKPLSFTEVANTDEFETALQDHLQDLIAPH